MFVRYSPLLIRLVIVVFLVSSSIALPPQQLQSQTLIELRENDPLSYAVVYARKSNNQFALSEIAIHYAELGDFEQAMRVNESASDEDWRTGAFAEIALEYWKHGRRDEA